MKSRGQRHQPVRLDTHNLIDKLSVIIGNCDLLIEKTEPGSEHARRLLVIRGIADTIVKEFVEHQRQLEEDGKKSRPLKAS